MLWPKIVFHTLPFITDWLSVTWACGPTSKCWCRACALTSGLLVLHLTFPIQLVIVTSSNIKTFTALYIQLYNYAALAK